MLLVLLLLYCIFIRSPPMIKLNTKVSTSASQSNMTERKEKDFKIDAHYIEEIRNAELINKKLLMHKKGVFPELHTSHTKKNFNTLLSHHQKGGYSPVRRYQLPQYAEKQAKIFYNHAEIYASKMQKMCLKQEQTQEKGQDKKIGKSLSQANQRGHLQEMSTQVCKPIQRPHYIDKMATEQSATSSTSKQIYQRLNRLRNKDKIMTIPSQHETLENDNLKEYKHCSFVIKFKVAQSHHLEKSQLKRLKNSRNECNINQLRDNIRIRNYTKFFTNQVDGQK